MERDPNPHEAPVIVRIYRLKADAEKFIKEQSDPYPLEYIIIKEVVY